MAVGLHSDMTIRDALATEIFIERLDQNLNVFNEGSNGAIRLVSRNMEGYYEKTKFLDRLTGGTSRRDLTSASTQTDTALTTDEIASVKRFGKFDTKALTLSSIETAGMSQEQIDAAIAVMFADDVAKDYIKSAVISLEADLVSDSDLYLNYSGTGDLAYAALVQGLALMGDASGRIVAWFGHSKPYHDLMEASLTQSSGHVGARVIFDAEIGTVNRPYIMTDDSNFGNNATPDNYRTFGLQVGAVTITESEVNRLVGDLITGGEQLFKRYQGEFAYNCELRGSTWDFTNGGSNPTDATLGTGSNWDPVVASYKDRAGICINTT